MSAGDAGLLHPPDPFLYQAAVIRAVTPVTYDLQIDVGFRMSREVRLSLRGAQLPDGFDPSEPDHDALHDIQNWFAAAAVADADFPLYVRTYKCPDPDDVGGDADCDADVGKPGREIYEADIVRKTDAANLRKWLISKYPDMENGTTQDAFDFLRGSGDGLPTGDRWTDDADGG